MNIFSKIGFLFTSLEVVKGNLSHVYIIGSKILPALKYLDSMIPEDTKLQQGLDKVIPVFEKVVTKLLSLTETVCRLLKVELPVVTSNSNDPIGDLAKVSE